MKLVLSWLSDFITLNGGTTPEKLSVGLVQLGHEVEGIHTTGADFPHVVVGKLITRIPHPNADKLGLCTVDVGEAEPRQIVCGAPNARPGLTVAVALPGAILPGDVVIKASKIRDVQSNGMICSQRELGLGTEHNGIWEMDTTAAPGTPLKQILGEGDTVLDVAITPNRGDCFSHLGLARDLAALGLGTLKPLPIFTPGKAKASVTAQTATPNCPQLNLISLSGINNVASPQPIQARLAAAGLRPKNALVDATNYTMLALGQPLHAYDAAKLNGTTLTATQAKDGQTFAGLGDVNLTLTAEDTIIADAGGPVGLAGILGGTATAVDDTTQNAVLEAAIFNPVAITLTGQRHQLHTDARQRFERGIDPAQTQYALQYCASLIAEWTDATISAMATAGEGVKAPEPIRYHPAFFTKFIGHNVAEETQQHILQSLGFGIKPVSAGWLVTPPAWRTYMANPEDLTEEILRVVGYESVQPALPPTMAGQFAINGAPVTLDRLARRTLAATGFLELMTYSFIGHATAQQFANGATLVTLANPLAQTDMTTLRPSLLPGLLTALAKNLAGSESTPRLAEIGKTYTAKGESLMAAGLLSPATQRHWHGAESKPDTFAAKAAAFAALSSLGAPVESGTVNTQVPAHYHPGRSGTLSVGPFTLAHFGELHPALLKTFGLTGPLAVFELHLEPLLKLQNKPRPWQPLPYPPVLRDLAFLLPKTVSAAAVTASITTALKVSGLLRNVEVFDHYTGERIPADKQSLALSLTLQSAERTLTEADITPLITAAVQAVEQTHQATLRA